MLARATVSLIAVTPGSRKPCAGSVPLSDSEPAGALVTVPALTPVFVRIDDEISSRASKSGDRFRITVAEDVRVGDSVVIPAGTTGEGEVIHAAKPGAGGKAGELIVAARFVRVGENEVRLRSFALGVAGKDKSVDALAVSFIAGPFAMLRGAPWSSRERRSARPRPRSNSSYAVVVLRRCRRRNRNLSKRKWEETMSRKLIKAAVAAVLLAPFASHLGGRGPRCCGARRRCGGRQHRYRGVLPREENDGCRDQLQGAGEWPRVVQAWQRLVLHIAGARRQA